jgi:type IV pilus assembly protein PilQ
MDKKHTTQALTRGTAIMLLVFLALFGCADMDADIKKSQDPFFEEWKARAEESQGHSPAGSRLDVDMGEIIEVKPPEEFAPEKAKPLPTRKISMKMNSIDVAVLLRALARAANQNIILNEKVSGKVNINIDQAPWDQVFRSILRTQGLSYSWEGEIIRIMTAADMEADLQREARNKEFAISEPPITRIIPIKFAEAPQLKNNLEHFLTIGKDGNPIGSVLVDTHTNSLIIKALKTDMRTLVAVIEKLDKPTPQILIEAHIVEANREVARELGVQWGGAAQFGKNKRITATGQQGNVLPTPNTDSANSGFVVDLPARALSGFDPSALGMIYQNIGDILLSVQLSALQDAGKLNILSSPSITTLDNQTARIESGSDVPFQTVEDGEVKVEYKKAVLSLEVTPHVIDGQTMKLYVKVHKDEPDFSNTVLGNPTIITKNAETNVIQFDGQTLVIGGLNISKSTRSGTGTPFLADIPGLGYLFKRKSRSNEWQDLLIFITPRILKPRTVASGE